MLMNDARQAVRPEATVSELEDFVLLPTEADKLEAAIARSEYLGRHKRALRSLQARLPDVAAEEVVAHFFNDSWS
jgi:hypothetical protein